METGIPAQSDHLISPKTDKGEQTLRRLFVAAEKLFYKQGYHATSIVQITAAAKVSNGTFYLYFKDKISLYKYMLERYSHEIRKASSIAAAKYDTHYEKEFYGFKGYIQYAMKHPCAPSLILESMHVAPNFFREYYELFSERYQAALADGVAKGEIVDCDLTMTAYMLIGAYTFIGIKHILFDKKKRIDDAEVEKLFHIWKSGLFASPRKT